MSFTTILGFVVLVFIFVIIFQIAKAIEYSRSLSKQNGESEADQPHSNKVNAWLMLVFLVLGLLGVYYCHQALKGKTLGESASVEGVAIDNIMMTTIVITGIVFVITQILLFWFAFKYRKNVNRPSVYFSHSNKLELIWTTIPAVAMAVLVAWGLKIWFGVTDDAPKNAMRVEVTGKQFAWIMRYPGKDGVLGKKYFKNINDATNMLGQLWEDQANHDDVVSDELHLVVGKPVELIIGSRDVLHDVGLPHFRMKMDAVPGIPTTMWFTPKYTTAEMKKITNNPDFEYEIACDQMCGKGHYSMKGTIIVQTQEEYDAWLASKKPYYAQVNPAAEEIAK